MFFMQKYYFLASLLPLLKIGQLPEIPFWEFKELCKENLTDEDKEKAAVIRRYVDLQNLRPFWQKKDLDPHGNYDAKELEEHLLLEEGFPDYVFEFLRERETLQQRLNDFPKLLAQFFNEEIEKADYFLKEYLIFERNWRLILAAVRAKLYKRDLVEEMQYEDPTDNLVAYLLAQKDAPEFSAPEGFEDLQELFNEFKTEPLKLHWELSQWRLKQILDLPQRGTFSIDRILGYLAQLIIIENWMKLSQDQGMDVVENIMKEQEG